MRHVKLVLLLVVLLAVLSLAVQNTETVTVHFLVWELTMSRFLLLLIMFLVGVVFGSFAPALVRRKRSSAKGE